jgi:hypothetical protein
MNNCRVSNGSQLLGLCGRDSTLVLIYDIYFYILREYVNLTGYLIKRLGLNSAALLFDVSIKLGEGIS